MALYSTSDTINAGRFYRTVMEAALPPAIALARDGTVYYSHGDLRSYLNVPQEPPLHRLEDATLTLPVRRALDGCRRSGEKVVVIAGELSGSAEVSSKRNARIKITAAPAFDIAADAVVLAFESMEHRSTCTDSTTNGSWARLERPSKIEKELDNAQRALRETNARLDTANQDLCASHEEALSMTNELQTSNRELEHSAEELRSLNRRLEEKVEQLKESHDDLVNFFASTEMATLFLDKHFRIKRFTPVVEELLGISHLDRGRYVGDIDHELLQCDLLEDSRAVLEERSSRRRNIHTSEGLWITRELLPYRTEDLSIEGVVVTLVDITDIKATEEALRESEARFREMADGLPQAVWAHGPEGDQELVNATFCEFFGVDRDEMKGDRWRALVHPEDIEDYDRKFQACMTGKQPFHASARVKKADGQWRWLESWGKPRFTESGEFKGFVGLSADVTEQKSIEAALRESEQRFRTLADNIAQLAWMADRTGHIFWYNQRWFDYTGTTPEQMQRTGWQSFPHPDYYQRVMSKYQNCIETGEPWEDTFPMRGRDGQYRWFLSRALPTRDDSGQIVRWLGTNTDITEQRQIELLLRESDQRKDEYLAMLGHELRNPLAGITAATELARLTQSDEPRLQHAISVLERQSKHVTQIVDGLLEVSRIARGKIELERKPLNIAEVLQGVLEDRIPHLEKRGLELRQQYPDEMLCVAGDWVRLVQIFDNLLGNAIKFTQAPGSIAVTLTKSDGNALISICDTGVGIRDEMLARIFEPFLQETQDVARAAGGLGLGLSLAKSLTELHGGTITALSKGADRGAEFQVRLPLTSRPDNALVEQAREPSQQYRVLIVEDNVDAADTLGALLEIKGHAVRVARTGTEALNELRRENADVILCDIGLPGMSGHDFARTIRSDEGLREIALIAITGYGQPEDRKRSLRAGFDEHLAKPVRIDALEEVLKKVCKTERE